MSASKNVSPPLQALGVLVRETRTRKGLTQQRAARGAGVSRKQWALLEKGENASAVFIKKVAAFLDLHVIPLGEGLEATSGSGGMDVKALFHIADDLVALASLVADRLRAFALEAVLPPSERGADAKAIATLLGRGEKLGGDEANRLSRMIHDLTTRVPPRHAEPADQAEEGAKKRKRRA